MVRDGVIAQVLTLREGKTPRAPGGLLHQGTEQKEGPPRVGADDKGDSNEND
jgi:hypothetical protein